jgi:hypothetical protein
MSKKKYGRPDRFIIIDTSRKKVILEDLGSKYDLGVLLIDFIEMDFRAFDERRLKAFEDIDGVVDWLYQELLDLEKQHPYFRVIDESVLHTTSPQELLDTTFNLVRIQKVFKQAFTFCMRRGPDKGLKPLTALQRYYIYNAIFKSPFESMGINAKVHYEPLKPKGGVSGGRKKLDDLIPLASEDGLVLTEHYLGHDIASLLYIEFMKMVSLNIQASSCSNCGYYFPLTKGLYNTKYCSRVRDEQGSSCKATGAMTKYRNKIYQDPIHEVHRRTYKRLHTRKTLNKITDETFNILKKEILILRRDAQDGKISFEDYKVKLDKI